MARPPSGRLRTYHDAEDFLASLVRTPPRTRRERERQGLAPIESLLDRLGNPHRAIAAVHITGSKGKGSTALYTEALLTAAGIRTGTFTSPHLERWNERIRIDGTPIDTPTLVDALERVRPAAAALYAADAEVAPAFFDALVAAAFVVFAGASVEVAVVEAGIGARLDPTRVCRATATCVTSIELEHVDRLGPTLADIAREKAAVTRPGVPLVAGSLPAEAWRVLERAAVRTGAPLLRLGRDIAIRREDRPAHPRPGPGMLDHRPRHPVPPALSQSDRDHGSGSVVDGATPAIPRSRPRTLAHAPRHPAMPALSQSTANRATVRLAGRSVPITLRQPGPHAVENAALALALANATGALRRLDDAEAGAALEAAVLPGRAEVLREFPLVIADGAHTRASIDALIGTLDTLVRTFDARSGALDARSTTFDTRPEALDTHATGRLVAVVSVTRGKDAAGVLSPLVRRADTVIATAAEPSRSLPATELANVLKASHPVAEIASAEMPEDALGDAVRAAGRDGTVCATGSMYMAGAARRFLPTA